MHEMGVVLNIIKTAERLAVENNAPKLGYVTVQVGELSGVVPGYLSNLWPMGAEGTVCEGAELIIETVRGIVRCLSCEKEYHIMDNLVKDAPVCPHCQRERFAVLTGREVMITEIGVLEQ